MPSQQSQGRGESGELCYSRGPENRTRDVFRHRKGVREAEAAGEAGNLASAALASELCARVRAGTGQTEAGGTEGKRELRGSYEHGALPVGFSK